MPKVFIPNNEVAPMRRMRMKKVIEFGACRAATWEPKITHIVVDKNLTLNDVLKYLKLDELPVCMLVIHQASLADITGDYDTSRK